MEDPSPIHCPKCGSMMENHGAGIGCASCILELALSSAAGRGDGNSYFPEISGHLILEKIGEGGFGDVYLARQMAGEGREVAIKVLKPGMDSREILRRFDTERRVLARMDHRGIAPVVHAGMTEEGRPFFAMEFVDGLPITDYCARKNLGIRDRLALFLKVCEAIQHAHQKGVIHRDIKPSNVLVPLDDDEGTVKVIDFGIAKAISGEDPSDATFHTIFGGHRGTPGYMSPEQAGLDAEDADTRSDVYGLGILLYELMTGTLPFLPKKSGAAGIDELRHMIRGQRAIQPSARAEKMGSRWVATLRGDLDAIILKALEKDREQRYESAFAMAGDLRAWLEDKPVVARSPGRLGLAWRFVRRHRAGVAITVSLVTVVVAAAVFSTLAAVRARAAETQARQAEAQARAAETQARTEAENAMNASTFLSNVFLAVNPSDSKGMDTKLIRTVMDETTRRIDTELNSTPAIEAYLRNCIGWAYHRIGDQAPAEQHLRKAIELYRELPGQDVRLAIALNWLAFAVIPRDADAAAIPARESFERVMAITKDPAMSVRNLATLADTTPSYGRILMAQRKNDEAAAILEAWKDYQIRIVGPDGRRVAATYSTLGQNADQNVNLPNRNQVAEEWYRKAYDIHERVLGTGTPEAATIRGHLATILLNQEKAAEAEPLLRQSLEDQTRSYGEGHPELLLPMTRLAKAERLAGKPDAAEQTLLKALPLRSRSAAKRVAVLDGEIRTLADYFDRQGDKARAIALREWIPVSR